MAWNLYLMRHGIAVDHFAPGITSDADRPLTDTGFVRVEQMARAMKAMDLGIGRVISSPYVRARQTAETVMDVLGLTGLEIDARITPMGEPSSLRDVFIEHQQDHENLLLVGHEPHMSSSVAYLLTGGYTAAVDMKKAGLVSLRFPAHSQQPPATLEWYLTPRWVRTLLNSDEDD